MPNSWFQFRYFRINQDRCAMKVGTDSVLLGAWLNLSGEEKKIADLGTGTGILSLIMAQRSEAMILGVESDTESARQAAENFAASPWSDRLICLHADIRLITEGNFDLCIFNPPYFIQQLRSPSESRNQVRHLQEMTPLIWMELCFQMLHSRGRLGFIIPVSEEINWSQAIAASGFYIHQKVLVRGRPGKEPVRIMFQLGKQQLQTELGFITIETERRGVLHPEFLSLVSTIYPERNDAGFIQSTN
jgi:tRNA1Val (adenine37-N6)-methyltransferase